LRQLARFVTAERAPERVTELIDYIGRCSTGWQRRAMLRGMLDALPKSEARAGFLSLRTSPAGLASLSGDPELQPMLNELVQSIAIQSEEQAGREVEELVGGQLESFRLGSSLYAVHCSVCHQPDGRGMDGLAPPLRDSEWVLGDPQRSVRVLLHGLAGPIQVAGRDFDMSMPGHGRLGDGEIAGILTYIRRVWNHRADPVSTGMVESIRSATKDRQGQWSADELNEIR
ncbi:MAG: c-type cytochrome, partial [Planctomycetota bacterium]